jgi:NADH:ubiquinone oxidoreductase subunit 3 (subunit A)
MGDFEVFLATISISILAALVYNVITILSFKDLLRRLGFMKNTRRDFYECGFKPQNQRPVKISLQFLLIWLYLYRFIRFIIIGIIFWCTVYKFKYRL